MKKVINTLFMAVMLIGITLTASFAGKETATKNVAKEVTAEELKRFEEIDARVKEIKEMDFKELSRVERKEIRKELKELNKEAKESGNGLYISTGALIVILILLIILL
ncbi:hypothetical protein MM236_06865 [Belliella sp. DSM 107340]|uniref:Seryl-tRNA synthetase n=1 Tax=Belliella calami TaxID=2923436 RepID=A0ABS9UM49_9BACT|nr:hypothetical protein [Belliella calami]MCH7397702.1 hypothetical protein [Belliella calami]